MKRRIRREERSVRSIPYRNTDALFVLQRVVFAPRAAVPVLHDECFRANVTRPVVDRFLTGIDGRLPSFQVAIPRIYIFNRCEESVLVGRGA